MTDDLLVADGIGLACAAGGFHVDPWAPSPLAVLTHAHADHARPGSARYLAARASVPILARRLGPEARIDGLEWGEVVRLGETTVSLHPSGHVLGAAQVRIEHEGRVWVVSGDFKRAPDPTTAPFEPVVCDVFVTEATFALPVYRWPEPASVAREILAWWTENRAAGRPSVLFAYALGKAQRILAELHRLGAGRVLVHGAVAAVVELYRAAGIELGETRAVAETGRSAKAAGELVIAPPSAMGSPWMRRFPGASTAFASGWMRVRGARRRRSIDRGFVLSDHADWPALLGTIAETGARRVLATHGHAEVLARYLAERGLESGVLGTAFEGERDA